MRINQLVSIVEKIAGIELKRTYDLSATERRELAEFGQHEDREYLGWEASIALRHGLERTYWWIYDDYLAKYGN